MPTPRKCLAAARLSGAAAKNPQRYSSRTEPRVDEPLGGPPDWFTPPACSAWRELQATIPWLNASHRGLVEITATLQARLAAGDEVGVQALALLRQCLGSMGATPVTSGRHAAPAQPDDDELLG